MVTTAAYKRVLTAILMVLGLVGTAKAQLELAPYAAPVSAAAEFALPTVPAHAQFESFATDPTPNSADVPASTPLGQSMPAMTGPVTTGIVQPALPPAVPVQLANDPFQTTSVPAQSSIPHPTQSSPGGIPAQTVAQIYQSQEPRGQFVRPNSTDFNTIFEELKTMRVGYDSGFVIASARELDLDSQDFQYRLKINGWAQLRDTVLDSRGDNRDLNQLQLKRGRLVFSGNAFSKEFQYFIQLDGRSNSGDNVTILDYLLTYDFGSRLWGLDRNTLGFKTGLYKMPFSLARYLSGKELEFSDRSMASIYFDVNRSLAWSLYGQTNSFDRPVHWEMAIFNGLVTGGAETGSSGSLDNNNAVSCRVYGYPTGEWGLGELADLTNHDHLATRAGFGVAFTEIDRLGRTEFDAPRVVDSGERLSSLLPKTVRSYDVALYSVDASMKYRGFSSTLEYYFRNIGNFKGAVLPDLFDHGLWFQTGCFIIPQKLQMLARWSRVQGNSGTLGMEQRSSEEISMGLVRYYRDQHVKLTGDVSFLDGAPINSSTLDINAGDIGWLYRLQVQFSF